MRKIIFGLVATAAIVSPLALATSAQAATTTSIDPTCVPVLEKAAITEVSHLEYKYVPAQRTRWFTDSGQTRTFDGVEYVAKLNAKGQHKTRTVIDVQAAPAVDGVNCEIPLPANPLTGLNGISPNTTVPTPAGTEKYTYSPVVNHIALNGKIGTTVTTTPGYVFPGGLISKVFAATPDNSGYVFMSDPAGRHINLPDVFDIEHTGAEEGTYWSTQVAMTVTNDTATDHEFRVRYADVQDGDRVWVERAIFTDGQPGNVVPANSSRVMVFDVWHNVVSGANVPDDLTLDFGFELA